MEEDKDLIKMKKILTEWNPLGGRAKYIEDLEEYETEACDILFYIDSDIMYPKIKDQKLRIKKIVKEILNEAFNLDLTDDDCAAPSEKIYNMIYDFNKKY